MSGYDNTSFTVRTVTAATALTNNDYVVLTNSASAFGFALPTPAQVQPGRTIIVRNIGAGTITLTAPSSTIDGAASKAVATNVAVTLIVTDAGWYTLGQSTVAP